MPCRVIVKTVKNGSQCLPYLFFYSHLQLHSSVQVNPNLKHLHLPRRSDLQPHLASCCLFAIGAFAVQNNPHCSPMCVEADLLLLEEWPHMASAFGQTCQV